MTSVIEIKARENLLNVRLTGKLTRGFYEDFIPTVEAQIQAVGKLRMLVELHDFQGWTAGALWEDMKFDTKHYDDVERLAVVGDSRWEQGMAAFCKPFTAATVRYFDESEMEAAQEWLMAEH